MPLMNAVGMNTALNTIAMATTAPPTVSMALRVASLGSIPCSMLCSTASTTTMASSTTIPIASTKPNNDRLLSENPNAAITAKVPTNDTGTATIGMRVARQVCRNTSTTINTRTTASIKVWITASIDCSTKVVVL